VELAGGGPWPSSLAEAILAVSMAAALRSRPPSS